MLVSLPLTEREDACRCAVPSASSNLERNRTSRVQESKLLISSTVNIPTYLHDKLNSLLQALSIGTEGSSFDRLRHCHLLQLRAVSGCREKVQAGGSFHHQGFWNLPLPASGGWCCITEGNKSQRRQRSPVVTLGPSPHLWYMSEVQVWRAKLKIVPY